MTDFKDELRRVGEQIGDFLQHDPFPETVRPASLGDAVRDYPGRGGKRIRPALVLWACELFGGDREQALPAAAAIEIYHNWTLVHDDIIDRDELRRGKPSTHVTIRDYAASKLNASPEQAAFFGESLAILAGDVQQGWAVERLASVADRGVDPALALTLVRAMQTKLNRELISGEARDVEFELLDPSAVSIQDVMGMINGKQSKPEVKEVYDYFFNYVNYLDNSQIVPETIYKPEFAKTVTVENWKSPSDYGVNYTQMQNLLDPDYKNELLDAWKL